jgi:hypothetical protein
MAEEISAADPDASFDVQVLYPLSASVTVDERI